MGRKNKAYSKDLHQQAYERLTEMQAFGESKKEAVANRIPDRINIFFTPGISRSFRSSFR